MSRPVITASWNARWKQRIKNHEPRSASGAEDTNTQNPIVPLKLREVLAESRLILLGYHMHDWEFRALFRLILKFRKNELSPRSAVLQLKPRPKKTEDEKRSLAYLLNILTKNNSMSSGPAPMSTSRNFGMNGINTIVKVFHE